MKIIMYIIAIVFQVSLIYIISSIYESNISTPLSLVVGVFFGFMYLWISDYE